MSTQPWSCNQKSGKPTAINLPVGDDIVLKKSQPSWKNIGDGLLLVYHIGIDPFIDSPMDSTCRFIVHPSGSSPCDTAHSRNATCTEGLEGGAQIFIQKFGSWMVAKHGVYVCVYIYNYIYIYGLPPLPPTPRARNLGAAVGDGQRSRVLSNAYLSGLQQGTSQRHLHTIS